MTLAADRWEEARQRATFSCEYCSITEEDAGGLLTVDHYHPQSQGGSDEPDNLVYCCFRCNLYKADYWPRDAHDPVLWNPRQDPAEKHFLTLIDGAVHPITAVGQFTIERLRLNRPPLVQARLRRKFHTEQERLLNRYKEVLGLLEQLHLQQVSLLEEHQALLQEHRTLLRVLLENRE